MNDAGGLFVLPEMHKTTEKSLVKMRCIYCLTFPSARPGDFRLAIGGKVWYDNSTCRVRTSVVHRLPKPRRRVRFPYPAPPTKKDRRWRSFLFFAFRTFLYRGCGRDRNERRPRHLSGAEGGSGPQNVRGRDQWWKLVVTTGSFSGRPNCALPSWMLFIRKAMLRPSVRMV